MWKTPFPLLKGDMPLLWYLRDIMGLTGTKFGCGIGQCGACTVHVDGVAVRACQTPLNSLDDGVHITTIEGLVHDLKAAWKHHNVPQCGYCQAGQIMQAAALIDGGATTMDAIEDGMFGNICRCGTYERIKKAMMDVAQKRSAMHETENISKTTSISNGEKMATIMDADTSVDRDGGTS